MPFFCEIGSCGLQFVTMKEIENEEYREQLISKLTRVDYQKHGPSPSREFLKDNDWALELATVYGEYPSPSWSDKMNILRNFLNTLVFDVVSNEQMDEILLGLGRSHGLEMVPSGEMWSTVSKSEQRRILDGLWKTYDDKIVTIKRQIWDSMDDTQRFLWVRGKLEEWEQKLEIDIDFLEDKRHPLAHLRMEMGYEVEHELAPGLERNHYYLLGKLGFRNGMDMPMEVAPGPFFREETARLLWRTWIEAGLIDLNGEYLQTAHLNFDLMGDKNVHMLVRALQATMLAYQPDFNPNGYHVDSQDYRNGLREFSHASSRHTRYGMRMEYKEFDVVTAEGFEKTLGYAMGIGRALRAWQLRDMGKELTVDQERLADVWEVAESMLKKGFERAALGRLITLRGNVNDMTLLEFKTQLAHVYPDKWARMDEQRIEKVARRGLLKVSMVDFATGESEEVAYPNIVSFAQDWVERVNAAALLVMEQAEQDFREMLTSIAQKELVDIALLMLSETDRARVLEGRRRELGREINELFDRFWCGLSKQANQQQKVSRLRELAEKYGLVMNWYEEELRR